ncbi:isopeptide-forming domain-containing fimbrial protein [Novosphingobium sp.]|uniref:isopeptide-forming domain-containing fimbrial protein n=1 Tax=Novosphingobium sp. TaxID=1874826 RepID=UPI00286D4175|nr:isopeptide-forming domain-containing fimbrial protein [Novosphingobium sp.]
MGVFRQIGVLIAALAALLLCVPFAQAQTITNTAAAQWSEGGQNFTTRSNMVSITLAQSQTLLTTYKPLTGGQNYGYTAASCGGSTVIVPGATATGTSIASLTQTSTIRVGEALFFSLSAPSANLDPAAVDTLVATITTQSGDREVLTIRETAINSGMFMGAIPTRAIPPQPVQGDCRLSLRQGEDITVAVAATASGSAIATAQVDVLADPYGMVFDSEDGQPVSGARVTLVDALTGAPARVFADDGVTPWPSTVISGQPITDGAGNVYPMAPGEYRFPLVGLGRYRLVVEPAAPYTAPSAKTPAQLAALLRPDGNTFEIVDASFGGTLQLAGATAVRVDIPLDHPPLGVTVTKTASRAVALPGDVVFYTVTIRNPDTISAKRTVTLADNPSPTLRLRPDSVRVDGVANPGAVQASPDGRTLTLQLGDIAAGDSRTVNYAMTIRPDAPAGTALNKATATDAAGRSATAGATVRIERQDIAARVTIIGRITDGGCAADGRHNPVQGVRVVLEDGSFAITDADGRYHFEGVVPGTHVVQAQQSTLPQGGRFADCSRSTRSAGSASSRFVMARGGMLVAADFSANLSHEGSVTASKAAVKIAYDPIDGLPIANPVGAAPALAPRTIQDPASLEREQRLSAGAETDWFAKGDGPNAFLFPAPDHNPRAPAIRVVIRHRVGQTVDLTIDGKPVEKLSYEGARPAPGGGYAVSIWRGIPLPGEQTRLTAVVRDANGVEVSRLTRTVYYSASPARIEFVPAQSSLVADGKTRPVLALRILDHNGRPVHAGLSGEFSLSDPYESADALDAMQQRQLVGAGRQAPRWLVKGDDGMAYVELAPTMVSGKLKMEFNFSDGQQRRRQELETWIAPGDQPWTVVGLIEGTVGKQTVASQMERTGQFDSDLGDRARTAFYVKGPVGEGFLVTGSYDSAKQRDDAVLLGTIDPRSYYTVFADGSDRRFDAASRDKFYVRVENRGFYALYGDATSGFDQTQLGRYQRTATGFKTEFEAGGVHLQGFAAKVSSTHRRDEYQGGGISGPYRLSSRAIVPGSEVVAIEVRDRFRSEVIVSRRTLVRYVDYDVDLLSGTITFKEPILSRDDQLNPQFIVMDYEVDGGAGGGEWNGGLRADATFADGAVRLGATAITDTSANGGARTDLVAVDLRAKLDRNTELRAEAARSYNDGRHADAWLVELEHHSGKVDVLAYVRQAADDFGLGQSSGAELGRRKVGVDARYRITPDLSVATSGWVDDSLTDGSRRIAVQTGLTWHTQDADARVGVTHFDDTLADGTKTNATALDASVARRFFDNKLELSVATSFAIGGSGSIDLPERHRFSARYAVTSDIKVVGTYEIAFGDNIDARTGRIGIEATPWTGGRLTTAVGQQQIGELGKRSFANFGLTQSIAVTKNLTLDATLDSSKTIGGFDPARLINPDHPASSGGTIGENGTIAEDYTAITLGGSWRQELWNATVRGEWREGDLATRKGATFGVIRQLGDGQMVGGGFTWTRADAAAGLMSQVMEGSLALASRPAESDFAFLGKLQFRSDIVHGAVAGEAGPAGRGALLVDGDARSDRIVFSLSGDWTPRRRVDGEWVQRDNLGFFIAARHNFDAFQQYDIAGTTVLGGLDARLGLGDHLELGGTGTVRYSLTDKTAIFSYGPQIGLSPTKDVLLLVGYNVTGFRDPDFSGARQTDEGVYATIKIKFDAESFGFLGLGQ